MSIIPGIETAAPERTETSSGSSATPNRLPVRSSSRAHVLVDLLLEPRRQVAARHVRAAGVGRDREPGRDGNAQLRHLGETDALAAEELAAAVGGLVEVVDVTGRPCGRNLSHARRRARAELCDPGERAQAEPERREQAVEEDERRAERGVPDGPAPRGTGGFGFTLRLARPRASARCSTSRMIRCAISSIDSSRHLEHRTPEPAVHLRGVLELVVDLDEARVLAVAAHPADRSSRISASRCASIVSPTIFAGRSRRAPAAARSPSRAARSRPCSRGSRGRSRAASSTCARRRRGRCPPRSGRAPTPSSNLTANSIADMRLKYCSLSGGRAPRLHPRGLARHASRRPRSAARAGRSSGACARRQSVRIALAQLRLDERVDDDRRPALHPVDRELEVGDRSRRAGGGSRRTPGRGTAPRAPARARGASRRSRRRRRAARRGSPGAA